MIFELDKDYITGKGNHAEKVKASDLICYWCNSEPGISMADLSRKPGLTAAALSIAVRRGEKAAEVEY